MRSSPVQPAAVKGPAMPLRLALCAALALSGACAGRPAAPVASTPPRLPELAPPETGAVLAPSLTPATPGAFKPRGEADRLVEAILTARDGLAPEKHKSVTRALGEAIAASKDAAFRARWTARIDVPAPKSPEPAYAEPALRDLIEKEGWAELVRRAEAAAAPFNMGRPEVMAAALPLAPDEDHRARFMALMFDLARTKTTRGGMGDNFEKGDFGHVLAEAAMRRCDLAAFDRAVALTPVPDNLRYAFWRARMTGGAEALAARLQKEASETESTPVLQAIDGLAPLLALGYCKA